MLRLICIFVIFMTIADVLIVFFCYRSLTADVTESPTTAGESILLTLISQVDFPSLINWVSPLSFKGTSGVIFILAHLTEGSKVSL